MSQNVFDPNDPRLTAYLLGELNEAERAQLERELAESTSGRQMLEELREVTTTVAAALKQEPLSKVSGVCRQAVANACSDREKAEDRTRKEEGSEVRPSAAVLTSEVGHLQSPLPSKRGRSLWIVGTTTACLLMGVTVLLATRGGGTATDDAGHLGRSTPFERHVSNVSRQLAYGRAGEIEGATNSFSVDGLSPTDQSGTAPALGDAGRSSKKYLLNSLHDDELLERLVQPTTNLGIQLERAEEAAPTSSGSVARGAVPSAGAMQNIPLGTQATVEDYGVTPSPTQTPLIVDFADGKAVAPASGPALSQREVSESGRAKRGSAVILEASVPPVGGNSSGNAREYGLPTSNERGMIVPTGPERQLMVPGKATGAPNGSRPPVTRYGAPAPDAAVAPVREVEPQTAPARPLVGAQIDSFQSTGDRLAPNVTLEAVNGLNVVENQDQPADRSKLSAAAKEVPAVPVPVSQSTLGSLYGGVSTEAKPAADPLVRGSREDVQELRERLREELPQLQKTQAGDMLSASSAGGVPGAGGYGGGGVPDAAGEQFWFRKDRRLVEQQLGFGVTLNTPHSTQEELEQLTRLRRYYDDAHDRYLRRLPTVPGTESYAPIVENEFVTPQQQRYSTFGIDVDTAAYANVRRFLENGQWPPANAVRLEELINSFSYDVPAPEGEHPVALIAEAAECPWQPAHELVRISLKGEEINRDERPATSLVFLIDKSGSMKDRNKLPLVKDSLRLLVEELGEQDRISIVTYASGAELLLDGATAAEHGRIMTAIDCLDADGSTNGEAGLKLAYDTATRNFISEGTNRILVCTDGDFNVGTSDDEPLFRMIGEKRKSNVFLSILGFGTGNIKDSKLEGIADHGNGHYAYIDSLKEARRVLVEQLTGTLYTIAKDVKLQVEFNPGQVAYYRLLGYENRTLAAEDFNNDRVDAGDMGAGHSVTALYEIVPAGTKPQGVPTVDPPRYSPVPTTAPATDPAASPAAGTEPASPSGTTDENVRPASNELMFVKLRYKLPTGDESIKLDFPVQKPEDGAAASNDLAWAGCLASFGMLLRDSKFKGKANWDELLARTRAAMGADPTGQRREFIDLVFLARALYKRSHGESVPQPAPLDSTAAREKATCGGKYSQLLDKLEVPSDFAAYGEFHDFGKWTGTAYMGRTGLPEGYWVYVYPHWYIWGRVETE